MTDERTDGQLVAAFLAGDRAAFASIYERFADPLHDTAAAMLRDRHEAADVTQDVFLIAAERLGQLREPARLRAWLFAILRNEVYRRSDRRQRQRPTDFSARGVAEVVAPDDPRAEAADVSMAELAADLREAARGLDARDQLVLELTARQGLSGGDLAAALGVSLEQSYVVVHRMRERVERSLGAFVVARAGRRDCPDLQAILRDWDGTFNVLIRKRVARHVEECPTCAETRRRVAVLPLVALAPALAAPSHLREDVLAAVGATGSEAGVGAGLGADAARLTPTAGAAVTAAVTHQDLPYGFRSDDGFPTPLHATRRGPVLWLAAAALVAILVAALAVPAWSGNGEGEQADALPSAGVVAAPTTGGAGSPTTDAAAAPPAPPLTPPPAITPAPAITPPSTLPATTSSTTSTTSVTTTSTAATRTTTTAPAPAPAPDTTPPPPPPPPITTLVFVPPPPTITMPPPPPPPPPITATTTTTAPPPPPPPPPGDTTPPDVTIIRAPRVLACPWSVTPLVAATVQDESPLRAVTLSWSGPGPSGSTGMSQSGGGWSGRMDLARVNGTWAYVVSAVDAAGNAGTASGITVVAGC